MYSHGVCSDKYIIKSELGRGGTSCVYLVTDRNIGKYWAMKKIYKKNGMSVMLAEKEIQMLSAIDFPMFPRITDAWQDEEALYIISDYIEGISLDRIINDKGVRRNQAVRWSKQIAEALRYLHNLEPPILYLDMKPQNILVKADGSLSIVDFGIAGRITTNIIPIGTIGYAAPEQFDIGACLTNRTDIFAFGMTYYAMRRGKSPDTNINDTRRKIENSKLFSHREKAFLLRCTALNDRQRFSSIEDAVFQLEHFRFNPNTFKFMCGLVASMVFMLSVGFTIYQRKSMQMQKEENARQMISDAGNYIENGDYTEEGIKIIVAYINGNCLESDVEQDFIAEVAMNYFEIQKDYRMAYKFFERLDEKYYPEIATIKKLCQMQMQFENNNEEMYECTKRLYGSMAESSPSRRKYEKIMFISYCFENSDSNQVEGIKKAMKVLELGLEEMESIESKGNFDDIKTKYRIRQNMLCKKIESIKLCKEQNIK